MVINMPPKDRRYFYIGSGLLLIFIVIEMVVSFGLLDGMNLTSMHYLQSVIPRAFDIPFSVFSILGSLEVTTLALAVLALVFYRKSRVLPLSLVLFGMIMILEYIGKMLVYHPGPPEEFFRYSLPLQFPTAFVHSKYSFPSGHVGRTLFVSIFSLFLLYKYVQKPLWRLIGLAIIICFIIVMIVSRIYLGEHWLSDVLGGVFLGSAMGMLALVYY